MAKHPTPTDSARWSLGEALDLPIALDAERHSPERDRKLADARTEVARELQPAALNETSDPVLLRAWLRWWRAQILGGSSPGQQLVDVLRRAGRIAAIVGFLLGLASASDKLFFTGAEPLNVFALLGVLVVLPLVISAVAFVVLSLQRSWHGNALQHAFLYVARKLSRVGPQPSSDPMVPDDSWTAVTKALGANQRLLVAPLLSISQRLALGFGVGLLLMLQLRVSFWELAFGWQTTLTAPGEFWHGVTQAVSAPWSWFWPEGSPSLEQINGTRYSRLDGAAAIDRDASRVWWKFLAGAILVWSVLLRLAIMGVLAARQRRLLGKFDPHSPDAELLLRKLRPAWSAMQVAPDATMTPVGTPARRQVASGAPWIALIADEPDAAMPQASELPALLGIEAEHVVAFQFDDSLSDATTSAVARIAASAASAAILLPASRDPIDEACDTLRALAVALGGRTSVIVLRGETARLALWKHKLSRWEIGLPVEYLCTA